MTIMSFNIFKQIRLNQMLKKGDKITRSLMVGYGVPAVIVCTMAIGEEGGRRITFQDFLS